jgi:hypothetical protein
MDLSARLEHYSERVTESGCQIWMGALNHQGYGRVGVGNEVVLAHRAAYELAYGPIPADVCILHRCDVPPCINFRHLFAGSRAVNSADMVEKSRQRRGETHPLAKLTDEDVISIRLDGRRHLDIAITTGISKSYVGTLKRRERWNHL